MNKENLEISPKIIKIIYKREKVRLSHIDLAQVLDKIVMAEIIIITMIERSLVLIPNLLIEAIIKHQIRRNKINSKHNLIILLIGH